MISSNRNNAFVAVAVLSIQGREGGVAAPDSGDALVSGTPACSWRSAPGWLGMLLIALVAPMSVAAQAVVPMEGEEVRVVQRGARGAVHGLFLEATSGEIVLRSIQGGGPIRIARSDITGMSVQRGERSHTMAGALIGAGLGMVGGIVLGQTTDVFDGTGAAVGVSAGVALPVGLLVGWLIKSPEWDGVDMGVMEQLPQSVDGGFLSRPASYRETFSVR